MWTLEVLEKENSRSALQDPPERESQLGAFEERTLKEGNSEKTSKELATNVDDTALVLVPRAANGGNQWYTRNPRMALQKERQPTMKGIQQQ